MAELSTPSYRPLEGYFPARFLNLQPGQADEEIRFELVYGSIFESPLREYEATSYTWGDPSQTKIVRCDGSLVEIRHNAWEFLHRLRVTDRARLLWMDCVCIDQSNLDERAEQVKFMHLLYLYALRTLIWLGPEGEDSAVVMGFAQQLDAVQYVAEFIDHLDGARLADTTYDTISRFNHLEESDANARLIRAIVALLSRPWMRRIWVQQEAAMGSNARVLCGADEMPWENLFALAWHARQEASEDWPVWAGVAPENMAWAAMNALENIQQSRLAVDRTFRVGLGEAYGQQILQKLQQHDNDVGELQWQAIEAAKEPMGANYDIFFPRFLRLLHFGSLCEATDPRDKVYALFNLLHTSSEVGLLEKPEINYRAPWQILYIQTAKWLFIGQEERDLRYAGRALQGESTLPSWVPDWRRGIGTPVFFHWSWFAGSNVQKNLVRFLGIPATLQQQKALPYYSYRDEANGEWVATLGLELRVLLQDRIQYRGPAITSSTDSWDEIVPDLQHKLSSDLEYLQSHEPQYFTGERAAEAYAATLIMKTRHDRGLSDLEYEREGLAQYRDWLANHESGDPPEYALAMHHFGKDSQNSICVTSHGLVASVPNMAQVGDYIAIALGFRLPFVIRKIGPEDQQYYELIGACYVHGMMEGQACSLIDSHDCKYQLGSENEASTGGSRRSRQAEPGHSETDYTRLLHVLGERPIVLV